jgi:hypothetical protein
MNDGSDARISKEIKTLSQDFDIDFLGIGKNDDDLGIKAFVHNYKCIIGSHRSVKILLKYLVLLKSLDRKSYDAVYVVDEQLLIFVLPLIKRCYVILDLFDSMFLKLNKEGNKWIWLKKILYNRMKKVIVTDQHRFDLLPDFIKDRAFVLPNYPEQQEFGKKRFNEGKIVLGVFGTLTRERGLGFLETLLERNSDIEVHCAGWLGDQYAKEFVHGSSVKYLGIMDKDEVNKYVYHFIDLVVAIYPQSNMNNYNASPTKLYDAIMSKTPVIMNRWVRISSFVEEINAGMVVELNSIGVNNLHFQDLKNYLESYSHSVFHEISMKYSWNDFEERYLELF